MAALVLDRSSRGVMPAASAMQPRTPAIARCPGTPFRSRRCGRPFATQAATTRVPKGPTRVAARGQRRPRPRGDGRRVLCDRNQPPIAESGAGNAQCENARLPMQSRFVAAPPRRPAGHVRSLIPGDWNVADAVVRSATGGRGKRSCASAPLAGRSTLEPAAATEWALCDEGKRATVSVGGSGRSAAAASLR